MRTCVVRCCFLAAALAAAWPSHALDLRPDGVFVQAGLGEHIQSTAVGAIWPWAWRRTWSSVEVSGKTEAFISYWRAEDLGGGHQGFIQLGLVPLLRLRFAQGHSPWFMEAGVGLTVMNRGYRTPHREFSTRENFIDVLALGRNFGEADQHELSLRAVHFSNANLKRPNPGENFLLLRYARLF